jgi:hypothetical protein
MILPTAFGCRGREPDSPVTPTAYRQLRAGATEAHAAELLGPPAAVADKKGVRTLTWEGERFRVVGRFRDGRLVKREAVLNGLALTEDEASDEPAPRSSAATDTPRP